MRLSLITAATLLAAAANAAPALAQSEVKIGEGSEDWPEVLKNYAKHYATDAPMPPALLEKMQAADKFNQGFTTTAYLAATLLDQAWHQLKPDEVPTDALAFEAEALKKAGVDLPVVPPRYRSAYFSHTFSGGYSAGYYSYIWSEVLDADSVEWMKQHEREYIGQWVALKGNHLIAHGPSAKEVFAKAREFGIQDALTYLVEDPDIPDLGS